MGLDVHGLHHVRIIAPAPVFREEGDPRLGL